MKTLASLALAVATVSLSAPAMAQFQKPEDAIKYRKAAMTVMSAHFGRIGAMASGKAPFDAKVAMDNAALVETLSKLPFAGFVPGTDKGETRALPAIWTEQAKFNAAAEKMQGEVAKLAAAAKTGNLDSVKTAFGAAGQSCKACHDDFRKE
ncbi:MAG: cytochrome c [Hydrogenophaga sp.]|jgi:cytochrome c556|uniref:Cytochrome c n=1 Tax=Hydrogenophaga aromaticivorans TaxID=2610898 RepID=A0A7Y8GYD2_9BURK|nr:cytochrome c [Hydrogenophaga aromaticivorans]MBQ0919664.1 cytochrome c [Hydrogenophaga aromaticivorans]MDO9293688.1 cytochrome c [Hydrogenophaga sp.]MDZ4301969.1 cytochrome c [Pseudomonas sp.]NWF47122.1 cytochrome c [Hydrogenophaga aromaticivorans]